MKKTLLILAGLALLGGPVLAATPTPAPTVTPTPTPVPVIPLWQDEAEVNAWAIFTSGHAATVQFTNHRTGSVLSVPGTRTLYITGIRWTCQSEADVDIKWNTAGTYIDSVRFPLSGQGKVVSNLDPPLYSPNPGDIPKLYFNNSSSGVVYLDGYIR